MTQILAYDVDKEVIDKLAEENDTSAEDVIRALLEAVNDNGIDIREYI